MLKIIEKSCHLRSVHDNDKIYVGIPNCFTIANTSYKNCFQHVKVPLTELINEKALSPETRLSIVLLKLSLTIAAVSVPGLTLCCECTWFTDEWFTGEWFYGTDGLLVLLIHGPGRKI